MEGAVWNQHHPDVQPLLPILPGISLGPEDLWALASDKQEQRPGSQASCLLPGAFRSTPLPRPGGAGHPISAGGELICAQSPVAH